MATVASPATGYVWEDPGDSIMIQVSLDLVERLGVAIQQGLGAGPRGVEVGGILLGRTLPGFGRTVLIDDFELTPCEHLRGASFTLSPKDRHTLGARLTRRGAGRVVGYFRSHTRPGMYLDQDDYAVFSRFFPETTQVCLLVRPSTDGHPVGGFFFWEDGDINRRSPYREFPFDCQQLATGGFPITGGQPAPVARPKPVAVPKPTKIAEPVVPPTGIMRQLRLPEVSWLVVPAIAGLFLIAGLFVSENRPTRQDPAPAVQPPVKLDPAEPFLLPQPVPEQVAAKTQDVTSQAAQAETAPGVPNAIPAATKARPVRKSMVIPPPAVPVKVAHVPVHVTEPPPVLTAPLGHSEVPGAAILPAVGTAPPMDVAVSYEQAKVGVFRRAFRKSADVPASPIRKVMPVSSAGSGEVDVKVFIDETGKVTRAQVLTKGTHLAAPALDAARQWQFTPAQKRDKSVASEMVLHFRVGGA